MSISLYSRVGEHEVIPFKLGKLNVITGQSKTGKTVLVKLIDYCLGRSDVPTSAGGVERALGWVGALWQFADGGRAFVGRPIPLGSVAQNTEVMLVVGDGALLPVLPGALAPNTNTSIMRQELGARIGITESRIEAPAGALRSPLRTHLGHAALLCLQNQDEISNSMRIFHRSGQRGIDETLRDTIPYFLGAVPPDQALLKATLRQETRRLQRLERDLRDAEGASKDIDEDLRALLSEAVDAGLVPTLAVEDAPTRQEVIDRLHRAARDEPEAPVDSLADQQDSRRRDRAELAIAEDELDDLLQQRALLREESEGGNAYGEALEIQVGRLRSLNLFDSGTEEQDADGALACPVCGSDQTTPDPSATQMRGALEQLDEQLRRVRTVTPAKSAALESLNSSIEQAQSRVRLARSALEASFGADASVGRSAARRQDFTRGRIDAVLARVPLADDSHLNTLRERISLADQAVTELQLQLSDDTARERLNSRLLAVGRDLTKYARDLQLEHSEQDVRIDLARLTVIADVGDSPVPLHRIGSAENWIGYHIASHLALHQTFIRHDRPVPRLLVIDQPSQGHYPSEVAKRTGHADTDADELAVRRLYVLMHQFTEQNPGQFQIIAVDHADIDQEWFQDALVNNWRGPGHALVPAGWLSDKV